MEASTLPGPFVLRVRWRDPDLPSATGALPSLPLRFPNKPPKMPFFFFRSAGVVGGLEADLFESSSGGPSTESFLLVAVVEFVVADVL